MCVSFEGHQSPLFKVCSIEVVEVEDRSVSLFCGTNLPCIEVNCIPVETPDTYCHNFRRGIEQDDRRFPAICSGGSRFCHRLHSSELSFESSDIVEYEWSRISCSCTGITSFPAFASRFRSDHRVWIACPLWIRLSQH